MSEKRQKKQAVKAFEKETFSKDKEVTGVKHIEHRQDNTFSVENQFSASEKPVSNLPRDANHGSRTGKATSGHSVQKSEFNTGTEYRKNNKKKYYRQQQQDTSGHNVQKSEAEAEKTFLKENSFINEENGNATNFHTEDADSFQDNYHVRNTYQRSEEKGKYHKRRVQREHAHRERAKSENAKQSDYGDLQTKDATFSQGQADEFTDQKVQKAFDKSEKNRRKLQKAKDKMPTKRQYEMKRVFDEQQSMLWFRWMWRSHLNRMDWEKLRFTSSRPKICILCIARLQRQKRIILLWRAHTRRNSEPRIFTTI